MLSHKLRYDIELEPNPCVTVELEDEPDNFLLARQIGESVLGAPGFVTEEATDYTRIPVDPAVSTRRFEQIVPDAAIETIALRQIRSQGTSDYEFTLHDSQNPGRIISLRRHNVPEGSQLPEYVIDQSGSTRPTFQPESRSSQPGNTIDESTVLDWLLVKFGLETQKTGPQLNFDTIHNLAALQVRGLRIETIIAAVNLEHSTLYVQNRRQYNPRHDAATPQRNRTDIWLGAPFSPHSLDFAENVTSRHIISMNNADASDPSNSTLYRVEAGSVRNMRAFVEAILKSYDAAREQVGRLLQQASQLLS